MAHTSSLTASQRRFIKLNRLKMSGSDMARRFRVGAGVVQRYMKKKGLTPPKEVQIKFRALAMRGKTTATKKEDLFLRENYMSMPVKTMADKINRSHTFVGTRLRQLGLVQPRWLIEQFKKDSQLKPGNVPINKGRPMKEWMSPAMIKRSKKGRFKKGQKSINEKDDGTITLRHSIPGRGGIPHFFIRISKGVWKELQINNWEMVNGPIPKGFVLASKDGNTLNCDPGNWFLLSKADNARRNAGHKNLPDSYVAHCLAGRKNRGLKDAFLKHPELLDLKRKQLILNRTIHEQQKTAATATNTN
jgi:hypothetical protein